MPMITIGGPLGWPFARSLLWHHDRGDDEGCDRVVYQADALIVGLEQARADRGLPERSTFRRGPHRR